MQINKNKWLSAAVLAGGVAALVHVLAATPFTPDLQPIGYVGQPVASSRDVSDGNAKMFSIDYKSTDWSGNLNAFRITPGGAVGVVDTWGIGGASAMIKAQSADNARLIVTINGAAGVPFRWTDLSSAAGGQQQLLDAAAMGGASSTVLDYIRGDNALEGSASTDFRARAEGLGDIIHSTPVYWDDGVSKTVFVGANDGMLHAINADDGTERFAYIPNAVIANLPRLKAQDYTHTYFVDGRMDIKKFPSKTVLVGTLGAGGRAAFALDVTSSNPTTEAIAAQKVMWEISNRSTGYGNLGYTYGAPILATILAPPVPAPAPKAPDLDVVVMGNGYNNGAGSSSGNGHAVLYLINAQTGAVIKEFDTNSGTNASPNGLSSPSLWDSDGDGKFDTAYAGDIDGNLWKFGLLTPYTAPVRLHASAGAAHAITMAPGVMAHPMGGVMVTFVTGRMLTSADAADTTSHYAYGVWDGAPATNTGILERTLTEVPYTTGGVTTRVRVANAATINWRTGNHKGWRTLLPIPGERVIGDGAYITGGVFQFFSNNPTITPDARPPGENWWMQLNAITGGSIGTVVFDLNGDRAFTPADRAAVPGPANSSTPADPVGRHMGGGVRSQLIGLSAAGIDVFQSNFDRNSGSPAEVAIPDVVRTVDGELGVTGGHFDTDFFCYSQCGGVTTAGSITAIDAASGKYFKGRQGADYRAGDAKDLNYIHVHEYDDMYDRLGLNMLNPSQDLQRLTSLNSTTSAFTYTPNTPSLKSSNSKPTTFTADPVTVSGTMRANALPAVRYTYVDSAQVAALTYPRTTVSGANLIIQRAWTYTTAMTVVSPVQSSKLGKNNFEYKLETRVYRWTTTKSNTETAPNKRFKVLMSNQAYSPAVSISIAGAEAALPVGGTVSDKVIRFQTGSTLRVASLPSYQMGAVSSLMLSMPKDAFRIQDWGTGASRSGVHAVQFSCVGVATLGPTAGPLGEWRNGALTVQIVDAGVIDSDIRMNVNGRPDLGYRLNGSSMPGKLIAEYVIYYHHATGKCMSGNNAPVSDPAKTPTLAGTWAYGEADPKGTFLDEQGRIITIIPDAPPETRVTDPVTGRITVTTVVHTALAGGGYTVTTSVRIISPGGSATGIVTGGAVSNNGEINTGGDVKKPPKFGRINWRELQR